MSDWDESSPIGSNYAANSSSSNYPVDSGSSSYGNSYPAPVYNQQFENSSYQNRNRGFSGRGRPNNRFGGNDGRRPMNRSFDRFGNVDGGRQNSRGFDRFGNGEERQNARGFTRKDDAVVIKVPTRFVGRIIGKGGSRINDLQFESGAKIIVTKEEEDNETVIKLIGSVDATKKAEEMIKDLIVD